MRSILFASSPTSSSSSSLSLLLPLLLLLATTTTTPTTEAFLLDQCAIAMSSLSTDYRVNTCFPTKVWEDFVLADNVTSKLINDTAANICPRPICSQPTVALIENTINQNCINSTDPEEQAGTNWLYGVSSLYIPLKEGMCQTVSPTNGTFCVTTLTQNLISYSNKKNPGKKFSWDLFLNGTQMQQWVDSVPSSLVCTPCTQSMLNPLDRYVSVHQLSLDPYVVAWVRFLQTQVSRKCGEGFIDALPPPTPPPVDSSSPSSLLYSWGFVVIASLSLVSSLLLFPI
ncbi:hypothetical protein F5H01DRAFT_337915 [Linnemannia elongata]|nr:hypothetical protein F5H01DRAFT_337915 [Linnemannia elongata]